MILRFVSQHAMDFVLLHLLIILFHIAGFLHFASSTLEYFFDNSHIDMYTHTHTHTHTNTLFICLLAGGDEFLCCLFTSCLPVLVEGGRHHPHKLPFLSSIEI
ncbi:MAG: hypothetical protein JOS17DRAFT_738770 [Linnemannia elongata]|nr:MAG: hypothetical protein JOS17DRAFT_738770 [Linnemannia elongata]